MENPEGSSALTSAPAEMHSEETIREYCNLMVMLEHGESQSVERLKRPVGQ